jgi:16S rRNA (cytosine967-C5)-methyltransferase
MRALDERPPLAVRANTLRTTRDALAARLRVDEGVEPRPARLAPEGLIVEGGGAPGRWKAFADGACTVQDEASMLIARLLDPEPGATIVDACAAPGTKTTHLGQLMDNRGRVLALDPHPVRLGRVAEAAARLGVTIVEPVEGPVETLASRWAGACDGVLVDAPCTNLGVVRRNPEVKWRRQPPDIAAAAERQRSILSAAARLVRSGGRLVYATCSLEPEENVDVVHAFLDAHGDFTVDTPPTFPIAPDADGFVRCLPHAHGTDGFTAIRLRRP